MPFHLRRDRNGQTFPPSFCFRPASAFKGELLTADYADGTDKERKDIREVLDHYLF
jgi:hypothetical protein